MKIYLNKINFKKLFKTSFFIINENLNELPFFTICKKKIKFCVSRAQSPSDSFLGYATNLDFLVFSELLGSPNHDVISMYIRNSEVGKSICRFLERLQFTLSKSLSVLICFAIIDSYHTIPFNFSLSVALVK